MLNNVVNYSFFKLFNPSKNTFMLNTDVNYSFFKLFNPTKYVIIDESTKLTITE